MQLIHQSNDSKLDTVIEQHDTETDSHEDTQIDCSESLSGAIDRMVNTHEIHQDQDGHVGDNQSRNSKHYKVFLDRRGGDRYLTWITDDYSVTLVCQTYIAYTYASAPEYQTFIKLTNSRSLVDLSKLLLNMN